MAVIATGFFDGVHLGHRLVIDTLLSEAARLGEQSVVVSFWPHPRAVLQSGADELRYLSSREEKAEILKSLGVNRVETVTFSREFAAWQAGEYLRFLKAEFGCTSLVLGYDTRFGAEQSCPDRIAEIASEMGIESVITPPVELDGTVISSSRIRRALAGGDAACAAKLLGRPYRLHGVVVTGDKIGRTIGFPTANMKLYEPLMLIPRPGVYHTAVHVLGATFAGMTNIGTRPTVNSGNTLTIETHILGFDEMIYGLDITVDFIDRIRDERRFGSLDELRNQLQKDAEAIKLSAAPAFGVAES